MLDHNNFGPLYMADLLQRAKQLGAEVWPGAALGQVFLRAPGGAREAVAVLVDGDHPLGARLLEHATLTRERSLARREHLAAWAQVRTLLDDASAVAPADIDTYVERLRCALLLLASARQTLATGAAAADTAAYAVRDAARALMSADGVEVAF